MPNCKAKIHTPIKALKLAYIIGTYPLLTTTFIDREINFLRRWGIDLQVVAMRRPRGLLSPEQVALQRDLIYLLPLRQLCLMKAHLSFVVWRPLVYFGTLFYLLTRPQLRLKSRCLTLLHFAAGVYTAYFLRDLACDQIHAHFIDRAATLALVASRLLDIPYSVTAHADDIFVNPLLLHAKLGEAKFVATCTKYNQTHLVRLGGDSFAHKLRCIYHGLDVRAYQPASSTSPDKPVLLAVGQLKEKKGLAYLLTACRMLKDQGYDFECQIVGAGPLRQDLEAQIRQLSLQDIVTLCGALPHKEVIDKYKQSTIFVLPCIVSDNGARDGIPNVVLEALAMQLPVVSTHHSGIPEIVEDGVNGMLVPPADEVALAKALAVLLDDPERRRQLGERGRHTVLETFDAVQNVKQLLAEFTASTSSEVSPGWTDEA